MALNIFHVANNLTEVRGGDAGNEEGYYCSCLGLTEASDIS